MLGLKNFADSFVESGAQTTYKIENRSPIRAFVPETLLKLPPKRGVWVGGMLGLKNFADSFVESGAQTTYKIENR